MSRKVQRELLQGTLLHPMGQRELGNPLIRELLHNEHGCIG